MGLGLAIASEALPRMLTRMDVLRLGRAIRAVRRHRGWTQQQLAERSGVSRPTVTRIEAGQVTGMPLGALAAVGLALELHVDLVPRWKGEGLDRLLDAQHAHLVEAFVRRYRSAGWKVAVEVSFAIGAERGSIDVLGAYPSLGLIAINEVKSVVPDAQATLHTLDRKTRLALRIAAERGWTGARVARFLVVGESRTARRRIDALAATFGVAYPIRGRGAIAWIDHPEDELKAEEVAGQDPRLISGLFFLSPVHRVNASKRSGGRDRVAPRRPERVDH
jgi:transcriptional regulator with XRE-family HTH domain